MSRLKKIFNWRIYLARLCDYFHWRLPVMARMFWGDRMRVVLPDGVSAAIFCYGRYEDDLTAILLRHLKSGDIFLDIGAHYGYFSLLAGHLVGMSGQVHAFEPTPRSCDLLKENTKQHPNIIVNQAAAWRENGSITFYDLGPKYPAGNGYTLRPMSEQEKDKLQIMPITVPTITLDGYCQHKNIRPNFIKLDAEQSEFQILRGMDWLLREVRPVISLETWEWQDAVDNYRQAIALLVARGYRPHLIEHGSLVVYEPHEPYLTTNLIFLPQ